MVGPGHRDDPRAVGQLGRSAKAVAIALDDQDGYVDPEQLGHP